ncbi:HotDog domain-containing protein [Paraphoma chrysanthemicola]|nr:HotDog domain-containing protein [Paraphoma chrysanthemicola]
MSSKRAKGTIPFDIKIADPKARVQAYIDTYQKDVSYGGFEESLMRAIRVISASESTSEGEAEGTKVDFELEVVPELCNPMDRMHGGAMALLADMSTTMAAAPIARRGWWEFGGVSRTLSVTYLRPTHMGSTVVVECILKSVSARLSVIQFTARDKATGKILALAEHGKSALSAQVRPKADSRL